MSESEEAATALNRAETAAPVDQQPQALAADENRVMLDAGLSAALGSNCPISGPMVLDTGEEQEDNEDTASPLSPSTTVVPSNTPVTADSGQGSPAMQSSSESLSDEPAGHDVNGAPPELSSSADVVPVVAAQAAAAVGGGDAAAPVDQTPAAVAAPAPQDAEQGKVAAASQPIQTSVKEAKKQERKEEKKKQKRKEDKGIEYILRALNSLQTPEEKLAALCKKYADLNEEHRVLQTSFKTQQRTMTVVMREKDHLQADHTRAMMAKSKLESLCRELQKHNKIIKEESIKRAKEDDEKRKEISAQFNNTIGEIQTQMTENTERNSKLRQENENLAAQLKAFINSIELRDQQVEKIQKHHELEKKLFEAKIKQAEAILTENTEKGNKERELIMLKLAESNKKNAVLDAQLSMYKERYAAFEQLSDSIGKYKSEMDKMTKRIKKLEKDGLQWKTKWENSNKALIEQMDARSKSEKETLTYAQKTRKLESLCRALQAELHNKKPPSVEDDGGDGTKANEPSPTEAGAPPVSAAAPPNSPEASSSGQCSPDSADSNSSSSKPLDHQPAPPAQEERSELQCSNVAGQEGGPPVSTSTTTTPTAGPSTTDSSAQSAVSSPAASATATTTTTTTTTTTPCIENGAAATAETPQVSSSPSSPPSSAAAGLPVSGTA